MTHEFHLMDESQNFLNNQQPVILKDLFPQGPNTTSISNVAVENFSAPPDKNYINMVRYSTLLQTRNKNYEQEASEKGKFTSETSNPLTIEKPSNPMPKISKGLSKI